MSVSFLDMSLMGGGMIALAFLIKGLSKNSLPKWVTGIMWGMALARLILPFSIPLPVSLLGALKGTQKAVPVMQAQGTFETAGFPIEQLFLLGTAVCSLLFLILVIRQKRILDTALPASMTRELHNLLIRQKLKKPVRVYTSDRISSPISYGVLQPRIVLPAGREIHGDDLQYVIAHECVHIKRMDALKKLLLMLVICLHWFNPLVWLMAAAIKRELELSCDQKVLAICGIKARTAYANALLSLEAGKRFGGILMNHFSRNPLETRIRSIMSVKKPAIFGVLSSVLVYGLCSVALAASPMMQDVLTLRAEYVPAWGPVTLEQSYPDRVYVWNGNVTSAAQASAAAYSASITIKDDGFLSAGAPIKVVTLLGDGTGIAIGQRSAYSLSIAKAYPAVTVTAVETQP